MTKFEYSKIYDISLPLDERTVVYPNNPPVEFDKVESRTGTSVLTEISLGSHTGTHIDAPAHVFKSGKTIEKIPLEAFIGPARVLDFTQADSRIELEGLKKCQIKPGERILFKTQNSRNGFKEFFADYIYLSGEAAEYLAEVGVALVGIDYLSIKQKGSEDQRPHTALLAKDIPIIESINLAEVPAGEYFLVAPPLAFRGIDGSPARALLFA